MNRFRNWYGTKNRIPEDEKNWFVKKTFDIVQAIKGKMKERGNSKQSEDENMHEQ